MQNLLRRRLGVDVSSAAICRHCNLQNLCRHAIFELAIGRPVQPPPLMAPDTRLFATSVTWTVAVSSSVLVSRTDRHILARCWPHDPFEKARINPSLTVIASPDAPPCKTTFYTAPWNKHRPYVPERGPFRHAFGLRGSFTLELARSSHLQQRS